MEEYINISSQEVAGMIAHENHEIVVLDVRTEEEFNNGHIEGALLNDVFSEHFRSTLEEYDRDKTYIVHCRSGKRSTEALAIMQELQFKHLYHLSNGFLEWEAQGNKIIK